MPDQEAPPWRQQFDARQLRLIQNCRDYAEGDPAGLPGHQLMLIVAKLVEILDQVTADGAD